MEWKKFPGYSRYEISNTGLVKNMTTGKYLRGSTTQNYIRVTLYPDEGRQKPMYLHRIVATLFCSNKKKYQVVNHLDGNTFNNNSSNLEWTTARKNTQHAVKIGKIIAGNQRPVRRICPKTGDIKEYKSISDAFSDNSNCIKYATYIITVCMGRQKKTGGYIWEYIDKKEQETEPSNGKIITGYNKYLVTPDGKIYSKKSNKYLAPSKNKGGYLVIDLYGDKYGDKDYSVYSRKRHAKRKKFRVHRLVAMYFLPNPHSYEEVNHKDKNRTNNCVQNLEWVTSAQNLQHAHNKQIEQLTKTGELIHEYNSINDASKITGINAKNISSCLRKGESYSAGGFRWIYM